MRYGIPKFIVPLSTFLAFLVGQYLFFQAKLRETKNSSGCDPTFGR